WERQFSPAAQQRLNQLVQEANKLSQQGDAASAVDLYRRVTLLCDQELGPDHFESVRQRAWLRHFERFARVTDAQRADLRAMLERLQQLTPGAAGQTTYKPYTDILTLMPR